MPTAYIINASTSLCALIITLIVAFASALSGDVRQPVKRWFFITALLNLLIIASELTVGMLAGHTGAAVGVVIRMMDFLSYAIPGVQLFSFGMYLYLYFSFRARVHKIVIYLIAACGIATVILATAAQVNHMYAFFDANNGYHEQPTFWISQIFPTLALFVYITLTVSNIKNHKSREWISLLLYSIVPFICYIIEITSVGIWISHFGSSITLFIVYVNIQLELRRRLNLQEEELIENRIAVMLSQIQPHFLYNALSTIDDLIYVKPDAAHQAVMDFSNYLRSNMDSLSQKEPIQFRKELDHTQQYLRLEKLRFGDRLQIVCDIRADHFKLPVLTLQPIVENAVRYGVTKKRNGGTVTIRTEETENAYRVTVSDDGAGFDLEQKPQEGRSHNGIPNVRNRLAAMCGGKLTIESSIGEGTSVVIEIPKRKEGAK